MQENGIRRDIESRSDIDEFVHAFYTRLLADPSISYIFTEVIPLDLAHHLPKIADFWDSVLLQAPVYDGNPMAVHLKINQMTPLGKAQFDTWLRHFEETIDTLFDGPIANQAKMRANSIAVVMQTKIWRSQIS
jgi:hemoglobin